jgi:hypothetical protein
MSGSKKIKCENIRAVTMIAGLVARQLHDIGFEFKYLVSLVRKLLVDRFGKPVGEGWIPDTIDCLKYVMIFSCAEGDSNMYAKVDVEESEDYRLWTLSWFLTEKDFPVHEDGEPIRTRISLEVVESRDESNRFLDFVDYNDFDEEVDDE